PGRAAFDDERSLAVGGLRVDEDHVRGRGERYETLLARDDPVSAAPLGTRRERRGVEVPARLRERGRRGDELLSRGTWQPALLLALAAADEERDGHETRREQVERHRQVAVAELLEKEHAGDRGSGVAVAAERLRDRALDETELPSSPHDRLGDVVLLVGL